MKKILFFCLLALTAQAQLKLGNNMGTINANSVLELEHTTKGMLLPRVSLTSTTSYSPLSATIVAGFLIYNTNAAVTAGSGSYPINSGGTGLYYWDGSGWVAVKVVDAYARANHTGTQTASTISDFSAAVAATAAVTANTAKVSNATHTGDVTGSTALTYNNVVPANKGGAGTITGILKANGSGTVSAAVADTDYLTPTGSAAALTSFPTLNQNTTGTASNVTGTVAIANGGTGATTAANARTNLGLGSLATQSGTFSGTSSGTNTGDQTITLTSDVTGSGTGSFATTIATGAVSLAKMANVATGTLFYRKTAGTGAPEVQTLATLKTDLGLTGTNTGDQTITLTSDVTGSGTGSFATTIATGAVSLAKMANVATGTLFYRKTAGTGAPEVQTLATLKTDLGLTGTNSGDQTITLTGNVTGSGTGSFATTIAANAVTLANMAQVATSTLLGRSTAGTGNVESLSASSARGVLGATTIGANLFTLTNPSAITFPRFNADNTVSALDAATFRTAIGAGTSSTTGTVTSVGGTGTVSGLSLSGTVTTSGNLTLGGTLSVAASNFASQTANTILAAPNGTAGVPTFRTLVAADIPTLNQNTTGTASNVTGTVAIANGGTGTTTAAGARTNLGATTVGSNLFTLTNPSAITFPRFNADNTVSALDAATFRTAIGAGTGNGSGTVTSVAMSVPAFLSVSGSPVTSTGTLAVSYSGTALPIANGGTGATSAAAALSALGGVGSASPTFTGTATSPKFSATGDGSSVGYSMNTGVAFRNSGSNFWDQGSGGSGDLYWRAGSAYTNAMTLLNNGKILVGTTTTDSGSGAKLQVTGGIQLVSVAAPSSASAAGYAGEIRWDASYIYVCTASNTWKRVAIATW